MLLQEAARFNKLNSLIRASLESLIKAVKGFIVMSPELELVFKSLLNNEVFYIQEYFVVLQCISTQYSASCIYYFRFLTRGLTMHILRSRHLVHGLKTFTKEWK